MVTATVTTIGHSNHPVDKLVGLLRALGIVDLVDVRSHPSSRHCPWFDGGPLCARLREEGISYHYMGDALGGMPSEARFYDESGRVLYGEIAGTESFKRALAVVAGMAGERPTAVMCSEEDPASCHRSLLVGRALADAGIAVRHARGDGTTSEAQFEPLGPFEEWKSAKPVRRRR